MKRKMSVSMMVYPADFKDQLTHMETCQDPIPFLEQDFVFCLIHINHGEEEEDLLWSRFVQHIKPEEDSLFMYDTDQLVAMFKQIGEHRKNGLFIPEYATWIVRMSVQIRSLREESQFACRKISFEGGESGHNWTMFFTASNHTMLDDPYFDGLVTLSRRRFREMLPQKAVRKPATERTVLTKSVRFEVLKRDGFRCKHCGTGKDDSPLHIDHIVPVARGGTDTMG